jgi:hypothetical protein
MSARSEQLVLDYLSRAADAAHGILRSDERLRFIASLRAAIEQQRQAVRAVEPAQVRQVLAKFGDPRGLADRERRSLDEAKAAALDARDAGGSIGGTAPPQVAAAAGAGQPGTIPVVRPAEESVSGQAARGGPGAAGSRRPLVSRGRPAAGAPSRGGRGASQPLPAAQRAPADKRPGAAPPGMAPPGMAPPGMAPPGMAPPGMAPPGMAPPARVVPQFASDPMSVIRKFPREMLALVLLGLGGLLFPFPLWFAGAAIGLTSRVWSRSDKLTGLGGPLVITVVTVGIIGALNKNPGIAVDMHAYVAAAHADALLILRITAVLGAGYLGARLPRGDRPSPAGRSADRRRNRLYGH